MMGQLDPAGLVIGLIGILVLALGYFIKARRKYGLMAGYGQGLISDPAGAADYIGWSLYAIGATDVVIGVCFYTLPEYRAARYAAGLVANVVLPDAMFLGGDRYRTWPKLWGWRRSTPTGDKGRHTPPEGATSPSGRQRRNGAE